MIWVSKVASWNAEHRPFGRFSRFQKLFWLRISFQNLYRIFTNLTFLNSIFQDGFCETHLDFISTIFLVYNSDFDLHKKAKTWISLKSFKLVFLSKKGPLVSLNLVLKKKFFHSNVIQGVTVTINIKIDSH